MPEGTVKFFNEEKGYGFIRHDNSMEETFVHVLDVINSGINPKEFTNDKFVSFNILVQKGKSRAVNLVI